jgi:hypothetical protein
MFWGAALVYICLKPTAVEKDRLHTAVADAEYCLVRGPENVLG